MPNVCCVTGCFNRSNKDSQYTFHRIPTVDSARSISFQNLTEKRRRAWLAKINRKTINDKTVKPWTRLCSKHFVSGTPAGVHDVTHPDWVPSFDMGYECHKGSLDKIKRGERR
ncbi:hypothetical protein V1264_020729 [Littorina saxatilis]|uniref:THAP-type domain-containing protein n=1 Tax=Littorina saxatilis TaxID=31220 RepID=A0AAN9BC87_9CAEN